MRVNRRSAEYQHHPLQVLSRRRRCFDLVMGSRGVTRADQRDMRAKPRKSLRQFAAIGPRADNCGRVLASAGSSQVGPQRLDVTWFSAVTRPGMLHKA